MSFEIKMPMLSPTMTKGLIANWLVKVGENVSVGDLLVEVETDKVTVEVEADIDGVVSEICAQVGDEVPVDEIIIKLAAVGTSISLEADANDKEVVESDVIEPVKNDEVTQTEAVSSVTQTPDAMPIVNNDQLTMSPLARRMASQENIDAKSLIGTGPKGRIMKKDIETALGGTKVIEKPLITAPVVSNTVIDYDVLPPFERVKNTGMRNVVASRLTESSRDIPHFYMSVDCELDKLLELRSELNQRKDANYKISVNDFVIKAVASAMKRVPEANCMWDGDSVINFKQVDISIAVAVEDGLITPVIKKACSLGLEAISNTAKALVTAARDNKLKPADYQGGTFTLSNLGMFGIDNFTSIINPPQNGILSIGAGKKCPVVKNGELAIATVMTVTLAMDHRCVDGAIGARFIKAFQEAIEDPVLLML